MSVTKKERDAAIAMLTKKLRVAAAHDFAKAWVEIYGRPPTDDVERHQFNETMYFFMRGAAWRQRVKVK